MRLLVRITHRGQEDFQAWCPELPGCSVRAPSREEAAAKIQHAAMGYLASFDIPACSPIEPELVEA